MGNKYKATTAFLGAGNYAGRVLMPAFKSAGAKLKTVVSGGGVSAVHFGRKHGFSEGSTDGSGKHDKRHESNRNEGSSPLIDESDEDSSN